MSQQPKVFVLLSGGIDSAVCLQEALDRFEKVAGVHFAYGQQTEPIERRNAEKQTNQANIPFHACDYRQVFELFAEGTIEDKEYDQSKTVEGSHSVGYVPQRNLHFLTTAAAIAEHDTETGRSITLYHGAQQNDREDYPDCRPEFIELAEQSLNQSTDQHSIRIETPLIDLSKPEVLQRGEELGVDWSLTFSCYNDSNGDPCGECPACIERQDAFQRANIDDPLS